MRALLSLTCGGIGRVATSAAFVVTCAFLLAGNGGDLARAAWFAFLWAGSFVLLFAVLAMIGAAAGVTDESPGIVKETDHV